MGGRKNLIQFFNQRIRLWYSYHQILCAQGQILEKRQTDKCETCKDVQAKVRVIFHAWYKEKKRKHDDKTKGSSIQNFLHLSRCTVWKDVTLVPTLTRGFCWPLPYWSWRTCSALKLLHDLLSNSSLCMLHGYILTLTLTQCSRELAICKKTEKKRKWDDSHIYWLVVWLEIKGIFLPSIV